MPKIKMTNGIIVLNAILLLRGNPEKSLGTLNVSIYVICVITERIDEIMRKTNDISNHPV
jgi:hypothetical protein